ncbi:MAG: hypothetical protein PHE89_02410 [Alphaproteobacteria bacterium]|nr:hypothetical protein [Alphaproteobacteria bacterium]
MRKKYIKPYLLFFLCFLAVFPVKNLWADETPVKTDRQNFVDEFLAGKYLQEGETITAGDRNEMQAEKAELEKKLDAASKAYYDAFANFSFSITILELKEMGEDVSKIGDNFAKAVNTASEGGFWKKLEAELNLIVDNTQTVFGIFKRKASIAFSAVVNGARDLIVDDKEGAVNDFLDDIEKQYIGNSLLPKVLDAAKPLLAAAEGYFDIKKAYDNMDLRTEGDLYVFTDANGSKFYFVRTGDDLLSVSGNSSGCVPLPAKIAETNSCLFCPLFKVVYGAANTMATNSYKTLGRPLAMVMLIGLAIFIAFKVMVLTSGFVKQDAPKFITELLTQTFKVLTAYVLLYNSNQIYIYAISPVLSAGMEFGTAVMGPSYVNYIKTCGTGAISDSGLLSAGLYSRLECFIRAVQEEISIPQAVGSSLVCISFRGASTIKYVLPDFSMLFVGLILWGFSWLVMLAFGFYLVDATMRIGIVGALMPFLIATWPFKVTSNYAKTGWSMIMNTFFVYTFLGIVIAINVTLMLIAVGGENGRQELQNLVNANSIKTIQEKLDIGMSGFLILIFGCLFGFKLTAQASALAGTFASGGGGDIAPKIGGLAASAAKAGALGTGKVAGKGASWFGRKTGITPALRRTRDRIGGSISRGVSNLFGGGNNAPSNSPAGGSGPSGGPTGGPSGGNTANTNQSRQPNPSLQTNPRGSQPIPNPSETHQNQADRMSGAGDRNNQNPPTQPAQPIDPSKLSEQDKKAYNAAQSYIQNGIQNRSIPLPKTQADNNKLIQDVMARVKEAESKRTSNTAVSGVNLDANGGGSNDKAYSYQTDAVGNVDFSKETFVDKAKLGQTDRTLYDNIASRNSDGKGSLDVDGTFLMAKAHQAMGGDPYAFGNKNKDAE